MKLFLALCLILPPALLLAQGDAEDSVNALIKKLGSANSSERQAATLTLQSRPEAVPALREALRSSDAEVTRRAALILDYIDRRPIRELDATIKDGDVERAIKLVANWPKGKFDDEVYAAVRQLSRALTELHVKKGGQKPVASESWYDYDDYRLVAEQRITDATKPPVKPLDSQGFFFLRGKDVDFDYSRAKKATADMLFPNIVVVSGSVRLRMRGGPPNQVFTVFAGGDVELGGGHFFGLLVVSGGDINLKECRFLSKSLVIARGKITSSDDDHVSDSRFISGKSVSNKRRLTRSCIITENELNPLGYIRWSDAPKDKPAPKSE